MNKGTSDMFGDGTNSLNILYAAGLSTGQHQSENQLQNEQLCSTFFSDSNKFALHELKNNLFMR